jgi:hypothetical protein
MENHELVEAIATLRGAVERAAERREDVRQALGTLSRWLKEFVRDIDQRAQASADHAAGIHRAPMHPVTLKIGDLALHVDVPGTEAEAQAAQLAAEPIESIEQPYDGDGEPYRLPELSMIVTRSRLKGEACRWAINRRLQLDQGADFEAAVRPRDAELIARARTMPSCFLWQLHPHMASEDAELETLAGCFENLAAAAELCELIYDKHTDDLDLREESYLLLAESQSALRVAMTQAGQRPDSDQNDAFHWLRRRTHEDRILVPRFMRLNDPASPAEWMELASRIDDLHFQFESLESQSREHRRLFGKARFHGRKIKRIRVEDSHDDWRTMLGAIDQLIANGVPPSDRSLREILIPIVDRMPDEAEVPPSAALALREVDRFLSTREGEERYEPPARVLSADVAEATRLMRGRVAVLIGGQSRAKSKAALEEAMDLHELRWIPSEPHESISKFEPAIARPETALVMLAIRWASHSFEGVKDLCEKYGKPYVRLPGGYGPNQVARQIVMQVSEQLRAGVV